MLEVRLHIPILRAQPELHVQGVRLLALALVALLGKWHKIMILGMSQMMEDLAQNVIRGMIQMVMEAHPKSKNQSSRSPPLSEGRQRENLTLGTSLKEAEADP